ncbi:hypothetical protein DEV91_1436 [Phyllobacterium brassicacearum]|nr:hypothetical protein DEV91_1436 [Phyllobacterium brassicacearum]
MVAEALKPPYIDVLKNGRDGVGSGHKPRKAETVICATSDLGRHTPLQRSRRSGANQYLHLDDERFSFACIRK